MVPIRHRPFGKIKLASLTRCLIAVILVATFSSAQSNETDMVTQDFALEDFSEVFFRLAGGLKLEESDENGLSITAEQEALENIVVTVSEGKLIIENESARKWWQWFTFSNVTRVEAILRYNDLSRIVIQGAGDVVATRLDAENLSIEINGAGDINVKEASAENLKTLISGSGDIFIGYFEGKDFQSKISGAGDVTVSGETNTAEVSIVGAGDFMGRELKSNSSAVNIKRAGDAVVWVEESLSARILGAGDIRYRGSPEISQEILGVGDVEPL